MVVDVDEIRFELVSLCIHSEASYTWYSASSDVILVTLTGEPDILSGFDKTENKAVCDCVGEEYLKYIKAGFSEDDAIAMYNDNPNSEYSYITKKIEEVENDELPF